MSATETHKQIAKHFFQLVCQGQIDEAYEKYVHPDGKHHNVFYPAGFDALKKGMIENQAQFPRKNLQIIQVLAEGDRVMLHSHLILAPGKEVAVVHIVRIKNDKIIEMWDLGQMIPVESPNRDEAF